ncbi:MAG: glycosyltransferase family 39 protein [Dehalococcoidia bacterium]
MIRPLLGAILLFAFAARVCWLDQLPPGFARDEAYYAVDSARVLEVGPRVFYPGNGGREGLFMALAAPFVAIIGRDPLAVRLPAAFAGVIFVAALFAFGRRLFRAQPAGEWVALTAAALAAGSIWLIVENRIGWRLNLFAPLVTVAGYWFWRAYETRRTSDWLAAGAAFGVAQYGYSAVRVLPVVLPGFMLFDGVGSPRQLWARRREWIAFAIAAGLIAVPLVLYAVTNPGSFFERQAALAGGDGRLANEDRYVGRLLGTLRMFFLEGAAPAWQSFPGQPVFNPALGALFLIGVALALWRIRRPAYRFILLWLAVFTLAAAIPRDSTPHFIHGAGILPVVFLFPAVGLVETARWYGRLGRSGLPAGRLAATLAGLVVIANLAWAWRLYFDDYRALPGLWDAFRAANTRGCCQRDERSARAAAIVASPTARDISPAGATRRSTFSTRATA